MSRSAKTGARSERVEGRTSGSARSSIGSAHAAIGLAGALLALSACGGPSDVADPHGPKEVKAPPGGTGGPPPIPPYQMRALASATGGEALFSNRCGSCHLAGGMGTNLLTKQMMMAKRPPTDGLLANRNDLTADYVKGVVRQGKLAMPRLTKVDVTDGDLEAIATYLGKGK